MSDDWKEYPNNRLMRTVNGVAIVVPVDRLPTVPFSCPVCTFVLRTSDDERTFLDVGCCLRCANMWAYVQRDKWLTGWRPSKENVDEANSSRPPLSVALKIE